MNEFAIASILVFAPGLSHPAFQQTEVGGGLPVVIEVDAQGVGASNPPQISFEATPGTGPVPLEIQFQAQVVGLDEWVWDFGDGSTGLGLAPQHTYTIPGEYTVTLTASGAEGPIVASADIVALPPTVLLSNATEEAGLSSTFTTGNTHTGGIAWIDYNGDHLPDLFITNGAGHDHYLFRNEGSGQFADVSHLVPKPDREFEGSSAYFADIENDGDQDLLVLVDNGTPMIPNLFNPLEGGPNLLYVNQGDGTFVEDATGRGILDPRGWRNSTGGFADFDRDGFVDFFATNWQMGNPGVHNNFDRMLRNTGAGAFEDATEAVGLELHGFDGLTSLWFDADLDMWPDLFVGNVAHLDAPPAFICQDAFYSNNGEGSLVNITTQFPGFGDDACADMGADVGDIDNDGDFDLYITDLYESATLPLGNPLYLGNPDGSLSDNMADVVGIAADDSWACNFADFNRDGWVDLWVGTIHRDVDDFIYVNDGDGTFTRAELPQFTGNSVRGGSVADFDGDGDVDIFLHNFGQNSRLFRNDSINTNDWLAIKLVGTSSNRDAIGARIEARTPDITQIRRVSGGDSAHSQRDQIVHFGLGDSTLADVRVFWPSGDVDDHFGVRSNQFLIIDEDAGQVGESLVKATAQWHTSSEELTVTMRTNYGGRTSFLADGLGQLAYNAATLDHALTATELAKAPAEVTLLSERGGSWTLPVVVVP